MGDYHLRSALVSSHPCPRVSFALKLICMLSLMVVFGLVRSSTKPLIVRFNILQLKSPLVALRNE